MDLLVIHELVQNRGYQWTTCWRMSTTDLHCYFNYFCWAESGTAICVRHFANSLCLSLNNRRSVIDKITSTELKKMPHTQRSPRLFGWEFKQPCLVGGNLTHSEAIGTGWSLDSLWTQITLWFYDPTTYKKIMSDLEFMNLQASWHWGMVPSAEFVASV